MPCPRAGSLSFTTTQQGHRVIFLLLRDTECLVLPAHVDICPLPRTSKPLQSQSTPISNPDFYRNLCVFYIQVLAALVPPGPWGSASRSPSSRASRPLRSGTRGTLSLPAQCLTLTSRAQTCAPRFSLGSYVAQTDAKLFKILVPLHASALERGHEVEMGLCQ